MSERNSLLSVVRVVQIVLVSVLFALVYRDWRLLQSHAAAPEPALETPDAASAAPRPTRVDLGALPLFGQAVAVGTPAGDAVDRDPAGLPESTASYRLFGVLLAPDGAGRYALIGEGDADQRAYREGDVAPDGARLKSVHDGWVVLERNGQEERLSLTEATGTGAGGAEGLPSADAQSGEMPALPTSPAPSAAADRLQARIQARRAAAAARQIGPKND